MISLGTEATPNPLHQNLPPLVREVLARLPQEAGDVIAAVACNVEEIGDDQRKSGASDSHIGLESAQPKTIELEALHLQGACSERIGFDACGTECEGGAL